jgi:hypothetical protein
MTLELEREEIVQALCAHYAQDHLSTGELEARFERVYKSNDRAQLRTVLEGLPAMGPLVAPPPALYSVANATSVLPEDEKRFVSVFASVKKEGQWVAARRITARVVFGSLLLDFREVELPRAGLEIDVDVLFGDAKILLPPGVGADVDCTAILGSVNDKSRAALPGAPVLRVRGGAVFGEITVVTKLPKPARLEGWRAQLRSIVGQAWTDRD